MCVCVCVCVCVRVRVCIYRGQINRNGIKRIKRANKCDQNRKGQNPHFGPTLFL